MWDVRGPVDSHDRQIRFRLPEPVLGHESPEASVMMQIPGVGPFVRALLAVRLVGGYAGDLRRVGRGSSR
jgi:hypothetical protein